MEETNKQMALIALELTKILVNITEDRSLLKDSMMKSLSLLERVLNFSDEEVNIVCSIYLLKRNRMTQLGMDVKEYDEYVQALMLSREKVNSYIQN
ncbi:MAG TPA: hypothetical protein VMC80_01965 [Patescibacteria group bacterium]|nr:hypothetical protein [Patescibacteria group bacterium]